ncbi:hypothetical protein EPO66_06600 [bacterium]|nr:MAG: hypothetical protein EPO66_06600 [bacterium]
MISHKRNFAGVNIDAFLFTTLLPSSPKILFNVESGDYGTIATKKCGCPYDALGFDIHISNIRSFEKLTAESMTFYGDEIANIIENVLPSKFGGSYLDYQFVEEEDENGITHLSIFVNPDMGEIDENNIIATVLSELRKGGDSQRVMAEVWCKTKSIIIKRNKPVFTKSGKLSPLHIKGGRRNGDS